MGIAGSSPARRTKLNEVKFWPGKRILFRLEKGSRTRSLIEILYELCEIKYPIGVLNL